MSNRKSNVQHDSVSLNLANNMLSDAVFRPMLFSTPMVQALLDGRKTQTRRLVNPQPINDIESGFVFDGKHKSMYKNDQFHQDWKFDFLKDHLKTKIGDIIWVRETFSPIVENCFVYKADDEYYHDSIENWQGWKPSLFMPKSVCRIWNKVTNLRIERLQDISEQDAINEGIATNFEKGCEYYKEGDYKNYTWHGEGGDDSFSGFSNVKNAKESFQSLWYKINGKNSWNDNPFVWVYDFDVSLECPHGFR